MEQNFFRDYKTFTEGSESPDSYHLFCSLVALSAAVSRKVWLDMGYFRVFPNLYCILVGPPGLRKTSALRVTIRLLKELEAPFISDSITKQKLTQDAVANERHIDNLPPELSDYADYTPVTLIASELSELIGPSAAGMTSFLTSIYDEEGDYSERTKNMGTVVIKRPYFNLLGCTTPEWINTYMRQDIIGGGFSRRVLFVYESAMARRNALPVVTPEMSAAWLRCVHHARRVSAVFGPFKLEPAAKDFYVNWYNNLKVPSDPILQNYYNSKHIQLFKVGMLVALSRDIRLVLTLEDLTTALAMLESIESNLLRVFEGVGRNELNAHVGLVIDILKQAPKKLCQLEGDTAARAYHILDRRSLAAASFRQLKETEFADVLQHLTSSGRIYQAALNLGTPQVPRMVPVVALPIDKK